MQKSKLEKLILCLTSAFQEAGVEIPLPSIESIAIVVYDSMSHQERSFHNIQHIFDVAENLSGLSVIAAVFHDIVYFQVDQGFRHQIEHIVKENVEFSHDHFIVKDNKDPLVVKSQSIFGINPGSTLNVFNGLNEYLSAIVAVDLLKNYLKESELLKVVGLIESTIPFRKDAIDVLEARFKKLNFSQVEIEDVCKMAVDFSNNDVFNFAEKDPRKFLNNTWNLISETNHSLRRGIDNYSVFDYRQALVKTYGFFKALNPESVFSKYKNYPTPKKWQVLNDGAIRNVTIGRKYLEIKIVSFAVVEATAMCTGGNIPLSLFMGDIRRRDQRIVRMEDFLGTAGEVSPDIDQELLHILEHGRSQESSFDMKGSPLAAFVYKTIGDKGVANILPHANEYFHGALDSRSFLKMYPYSVLDRIINSCAEISSTRKDKLHKLLHSLVH